MKYWQFFLIMMAVYASPRTSPKTADSVTLAFAGLAIVACSWGWI